MFKITIKNIFVIIVGIVGFVLILKAMSGDFEGAIIGWANLQVPLWVTLPSGLIIFGIVIYMIFKKPIDDFVNNFDLSKL